MMHQRLRTQILRRNWVYLRSSCIAQVSYILLEHIRRTLKILIESGYFYWFIFGKSKFSGMLIFKGFGTQNMKTIIPRTDLSSDIVHSHPQLLMDKFISTSEIRAIYIDKKKAEVVLQFQFCLGDSFEIFLPRSVWVYVETLVSLDKLR